MFGRRKEGGDFGFPSPPGHWPRIRNLMLEDPELRQLLVQDGTITQEHADSIGLELARQKQEAQKSIFTKTKDKVVTSLQRTGNIMTFKPRR